MRKVRNLPSHENSKATISIPGELSKLVKLKERGVIIEEEFFAIDKKYNEENVNYNP
jgi:hypothetical protein